MPRRANGIAIICAHSLCAMWLCGCISANTLPPFDRATVLPSEFLGSQTLSNGSSGVSPYRWTPSTITTVPTSTPTSISPPVADSTNGIEEGTVPNPTRSTATSPDLRHIYGRTAQSDDRERNPIIVIPGVLGSRLVDDQARRVVWGEFGGDGINPESGGGARLIALPMQQGQRLDSLTDGVRAAGTLDALDVRFFGIPFQINAYRDLLTALGVGGYRDPDTNLADVDYGNQTYSSFQFAYDWRRDNVENARRLHQFILEKKAYIETERRNRYQNDLDPVRFDIVAHSMGGLIARYFLEYGDADLPADGSTPTMTWAGAEHVDRLVMIATPNAGSIDAMANLVRGEKLSQFLPRYEPAVLGTMPALYQLLPRSRQNPVIAEGDRRGVDIFDPKIWAQFRWGLLDPRQHRVLQELLPEVRDPNARLQIAYEHLTKCLNRAKAFQAAIDVPANPPAGTTIHLIAGDAHATTSQFRVDQRGQLTVTEWKPGDGRVSRSSALMDERDSASVKWSPRLISPIKWSSVNFLFADHLGLTSDPGFTDNVLFLLLESAR